MIPDTICAAARLIASFVPDLFRRPFYPVIALVDGPCVGIVTAELLMAHLFGLLLEERLERFCGGPDGGCEPGVVHSGDATDGAEHQRREVTDQEEYQQWPDELPPIELKAFEVLRADADHGDGRAGRSQRNGHTCHSAELGREDVLLDGGKKRLHRCCKGVYRQRMKHELYRLSMKHERLITGE